MKFILGKKIEMSQRFKEDGCLEPVTVIQAEPCLVTQIKTQENDGYQAVQVGCSPAKKLTKAEKGHLKGLKDFKHLREFGVSDTASFKKGQEINVSIFNKGDRVQIIGVSKGKGFQGVVRRHGFHGSPASHGHKDQLRMPGSIGSTAPQRVLKGMRMAGRMGGGRITVKNLEVIEVDKDKNLLLVKGAVPGARHNLLLIQSQ